MAKTIHQDREVEQYRNLLEVPDTFEDGFNRTTIVGLVFCGLVMIPGSIYLGLMTGGQFGDAAAWVTTILFMEIARRSMKPMSKQNLVVLLHAARVMMAGSVLLPGGPLAALVYRAYLVSSDAVRDAGMLGAFPSWFSPAPDSPAITERDLMHADWHVPILLMLFILALGLVKRYTLGYFFFRLTSDVEKLPFPRAPIAAQGTLALAEAEQAVHLKDPLEALKGKNPKDQQKSMRWRVFSMGAYLGIAFGTVQIGIPAVTGLFLEKPIFLIPQPFVDTTTMTEGFLPASATGIALDLGILFIGFVLPFWSIMGTFAAVLLTTFLSPILFQAGVLTTWQPGMDTVNTMFSNNIDFWLSFNVGAAFGVAAISIYSTVRDLRRKVREDRAAATDGGTRTSLWTPPRAGRGDYPLWIALTIYAIAAAVMVVVALILVPLDIRVVFFLLFFAFVYSPFISYISARLIGISGQRIDIPYMREMGFIASGAKGIEIWLAPVPLDNYGDQAQAFRVNELTGVSFWSLVKTDLIALPILFFCSFVFWAFIWNSDPIPSEIFPAAQVQWELAAKNQVLIFSSTFVPAGEDPATRSILDSEFMNAVHPSVIGTGFLSIVGLFGFLSWAGLPVMFVYGTMRGFGQFPHLRILEVVGALLARYYFKKKYGEQNFMRLAPALLAGYLTGVGLIGMSMIALRLIKSAVTSAPF